MSDAQPFLIGDWGSSAMRLYLCRSAAAGPEILDTASGPGIKFCADIEEAFFAAAQPWFDAHGPLPVTLGGMIGSPLGWRDCPYAACPTSVDRLQSLVTRFEARGVPITIAPGLRCTSVFGLPDVMRGEEMQIFGWLADADVAADEARLLCLPGTHAKWAITRGKSVESFFTSMQGEMFEVLVSHSLLGRAMELGPDRAAIPDPEEFARGVALMVDQPELALEHAVFASRSRIVTGGLAPASASSFLSGVLIGADVRDAVRAHAGRALLDTPVVLIGAERLCGLYAQALAALDIESISVSAHDASIRGLSALAEAVPADA